MILSCSKLILGLLELLVLSLYLLFDPLQSSLDALLLPVSFGELDIQLLDLLLCHLEGLHSSNMPGFFIFHLPMGVVHQFLGSMCNLDNLSREQAQQFKKKFIYNFEYEKANLRTYQSKVLLQVEEYLMLPH